MMNKKYTKKALSYNILIMLIIAIIFLIVFLNIINNFQSNSKYETSKIQCFEAFKKIPENPDLFFSKVNGKYELGKALSNNCDSTNYLIENKNLNNAVTAIEDCYYKTNKLANIFPGSQFEPRTICMTCGYIKTTQKIDNFNVKLIKKLQDKKAELTTDKGLNQNLNGLFLYNKKFLPETLDVNQKIVITYFTAKLAQKYTKNSKNSLDTSFGQTNNNKVKTDIRSLVWNGINDKVNLLVNFIGVKPKNIVSGIALYKINSDNTNDFTQSKKVELYTKNNYIKCSEFIVSNKENQFK